MRYNLSGLRTRGPLWRNMYPIWSNPCKNVECKFECGTSLIRDPAKWTFEFTRISHFTMRNYNLIVFTIGLFYQKYRIVIN